MRYLVLIALVLVAGSLTGCSVLRLSEIGLGVGAVKDRGTKPTNSEIGKIADCHAL